MKISVKMIIAMFVIFTISSCGFYHEGEKVGEWPSEPDSLQECGLNFQFEHDWDPDLNQYYWSHVSVRNTTDHYARFRLTNEDTGLYVLDARVWARKSTGHSIYLPKGTDAILDVWHKIDGVMQSCTGNGTIIDL